MLPLLKSGKKVSYEKSLKTQKAVRMKEPNKREQRNKLTLSAEISLNDPRFAIDGSHFHWFGVVGDTSREFRVSIAKSGTQPRSIGGCAGPRRAGGVKQRVAQLGIGAYRYNGQQHKKINIG